MSEVTSNQLSMTSTPIKMLANDDNASLAFAKSKSIKPNSGSKDKQSFNQQSSHDMINLQNNSFKPIAPSPNKPLQIPIAAKPTQTTVNRPLSNAQSTQIPTTSGQINILSASQLEQQQKQYILQQQYQQQLATYQRLQLQQQAPSNKLQQAAMNQSLAHKIMNASNQNIMKQPSQNSSPSLANSSAIMNMSSQIPQHILQYLSSTANNLQASSDSKKSMQMIQPKKQSNENKPDQQQIKSQPLANNQQAPIRLITNAASNITPSSSASPTIFSATTTPDGQIIFKTVKPTAATNAALVAYQQQQLLQQQQIKPAATQSKNTPNNLTQVQIASKQPSTQINQNKVLSYGMKQQELLQQKLQLETLKYQKLKKKWDELDNKPTNQQKAANQSQSQLNSNQNQHLINIVSSEIEKITNEDAKKVPVSDEIKSNLSLNEPSKTSTMGQQSNEPKSFQDALLRMLKSSSPGKKKPRGRPRLYAVNPITGRSMKGQLLDKTSTNNAPERVQEKNVLIAKEHNDKNKLPIYPSPTSSNSSCPQNEFPLNKETVPTPTDQPEQVIEIDLNSQNEDESANDSEQSYSSESEDEGQCVQNNETLPDLNQNKNVTKNSDKENTHNETVRETVPVNETNVAMLHEPQTNNNVSLKRIASPPSPSSSASSRSSRISSRSSSSSSSTSLTSSLKRRSNQEILETTRNFTKFPPVIPQDTVLTHVIEGFVLKESSNPFPVKKSDSLSNQSAQNCFDREILNLYLEKIQDSRREMQKSLEKSFEFKQPMLQQPHHSPDNREKSGSSPPKSTSTPSNRKSFDTQTLTKVTQSPCNYTSPQENISQMYSPFYAQNAWKEPPALNYSINGNKKLRKSVENHQMPTSNEKENRSSLSFSGDTNNIKMPSLVAPYDNSTFLSLQAPQQQPIAKGISPKPYQATSNNYLNSSKNSIENEISSGDPTEWTCDDVFNFVKQVAGITVAELFLAQEVDGSALSLIRDDHLVNTMHIKLGPALKIMSKFNEIKLKFNNSMSI